MFNIVFYQEELPASAAPKPVSYNIDTLSNGAGMFYSQQVEVTPKDLSALHNGTNMFNGNTVIQEITSGFDHLQNGYAMFNGCTNLNKVISNFDKLQISAYMFSGCTSLKSFTGDLSHVINGERMFEGCTSLTSFTGDLSSLSSGIAMFGGCSALTEFDNGNLNELKYSSYMFSECPFKSFTGDLSSLIDGYRMFYGCTSLTSFAGDLSSLVSGDGMFQQCRLDALSLRLLIESINDMVQLKSLYESGQRPYVTRTYVDGVGYVLSEPEGLLKDGRYAFTYFTDTHNERVIDAAKVAYLTVGIEVESSNALEEPRQLQEYAEAAGFDSWEAVKQAFVNKGWEVAFTFGGGSTAVTYNMREGNTKTPAPIYVHLIEVEDDTAEYVSLDGTKFYQLNWGHDVTHPEKFQKFASLEEAREHYGILFNTKDEQ